MSMEKITKEELMEKFLGVPLTDDELEKVSGGTNNFLFGQRQGRLIQLYVWL